MEETEADGMMTVGQRLREARESQNLSIEDIAASTRIPTRHLASLETSEWDNLPAATYSIGFAKNYATAVGLDRNEIGDQLRAEMGGYRAPETHAEVYEAADPARTMPKGLVFGALGLLLLAVLGFTWMSNRSIEGSGQPAPGIESETPSASAPTVATPAPAPAATGPVVLTANEPVWIEVKDGTALLKQGELAAGQSFEVPANAAAPVLTTGKPEALRVSVGTADAPPVGPAGRTVSRVSLRAADLMRAPPTNIGATGASATQPPANSAAPAATAQ